MSKQRDNIEQFRISEANQLLNSVRSKIILLGCIPVCIVLIYLIVYMIPSLKSDILDEKKVQTKELVEIGLSVLDHFHSMEEAGILSMEEAQSSAKDVVRSMRFGNDLLDYYWINDLEKTVLVHPFRPDLEGTDMFGMPDPDGENIIAEFVDMANKEGSGYVAYKWQYYHDKNRIEPKIAYVSIFSPWDWVIGTAFYLTDVEETFVEVAKKSNVFHFGSTSFSIGVLYPCQ